jgi:hypothetical protein
VDTQVVWKIPTEVEETEMSEEGAFQ